MANHDGQSTDALATVQPIPQIVENAIHLSSRAEAFDDFAMIPSHSQWPGGSFSTIALLNLAQSHFATPALAICLTVALCTPIPSTAKLASS